MRMGRPRLRKSSSTTLPTTISARGFKTIAAHQDAGRNFVLGLICKIRAAGGCFFDDKLGLNGYGRLNNLRTSSAVASE